MSKFNLKLKNVKSELHVILDVIEDHVGCKNEQSHSRWIFLLTETQTGIKILRSFHDMKPKYGYMLREKEALQARVPHWAE